MGEEELSRGRNAAQAGAPPSPPLKSSGVEQQPAAASRPPAAAAPPPAAVAAAVPASRAEGGTPPRERDLLDSSVTGRRVPQQPSRTGSALQRNAPPFSSPSAAAADEPFLRRRHETAAAGGRRPADYFDEREKKDDFSAAPADKATLGRRCCRCGCPRRTFSDFMQQRLPAWQPVLSPRRILTALGVCGVVFLALGILILVCSNRILECKVNYTHEAGTEVLLRIGPEHCTDTTVKEITGDVYLFFELHNFYQNHRRYLKSRSDAQLQGKIYTNPGDVKAVCDPRYLSEDGRVLDPCGLNAVAVFTDAYSLWREGPTGSLLPVGLDETRETICWHFDLRSRYKNPSLAERTANAAKVDFWLFEPEMRKALHMDKPGVGEGVENSHFIVWMREAALPDFRKVYGKIEESPVKLPFFVRVSGNYDVASFGGKKFVVVSQASWLGGRNSFLGITYIVVACVCIIVFLLLGYAQMRNPRHMGDVSWLRKALYADG